LAQWQWLLDTFSGSGIDKWQCGSGNRQVAVWQWQCGSGCGIDSGGVSLKKMPQKPTATATIASHYTTTLPLPLYHTANTATATNHKKNQIKNQLFFCFSSFHFSRLLFFFFPPPVSLFFFQTFFFLFFRHFSPFFFGHFDIFFLIESLFSRFFKRILTVFSVIFRSFWCVLGAFYAFLCVFDVFFGVFSCFCGIFGVFGPFLAPSGNGSQSLCHTFGCGTVIGAKVHNIPVFRGKMGVFEAKNENFEAK
jgi:hypothetical protein